MTDTASKDLTNDSYLTDNDAQPVVPTGFKVRYASAVDEFTTYQLHSPVDGTHYKVKAVQPVCFLPTPGYRIDDTDVAVPRVISTAQGGRPVGIVEAINTGLIDVRDRWERPLSNTA